MRRTAPSRRARRIVFMVLEVLLVAALFSAEEKPALTSVTADCHH